MSRHSNMTTRELCFVCAITIPTVLMHAGQNHGQNKNQKIDRKRKKKEKKGNNNNKKRQPTQAQTPLAGLPLPHFRHQLFDLLSDLCKLKPKTRTMYLATILLKILFHNDPVPKMFKRFFFSVVSFVSFRKFCQHFNSFSTHSTPLPPIVRKLTFRKCTAKLFASKSLSTYHFQWVLFVVVFIYFFPFHDYWIMICQKWHLQCTHDVRDLHKRPGKKNIKKKPNSHPQCDLIVFKWRAYHVGALRGKNAVRIKCLNRSTLPSLVTPHRIGGNCQPTEWQTYQLN